MIKLGEALEKPNIRCELDQLPDGITQLLKKWTRGDQESLDRVFTLLYKHLHEEAGKRLYYMKVNGPLLRPTHLVGAVYEKLRSQPDFEYLNRSRFMWFAGKLIRHIIVDHIRSSVTDKRRHTKVHLENDDQISFNSPENHKLDPEFVLAIHEALADLEAVNSRRAHVVDLRFFIGASIPETAEILEVGTTKVKEEWAAAKIWLFERLDGKL